MTQLRNKQRPNWSLKYPYCETDVDHVPAINR